MRVLFISGEMIAADLAYRLKLEGCDVKLFIDDKSRKDCFDGLVEKTNNWRKELKWVGKDGLIVFDDIGYGAAQDDLRDRGYTVFGGSERGERLERDREFGQSILAASGMKPLETNNFSNINDAIRFIKRNRKAWVLKQNGHYSSLSYVGVLNNGEDVIEILRNYKVNKLDIKSLCLQRKVEGIEVAAGRFFNGNDWVGPICINFEHKPLLNGDIGPLTGEMGTLAWYEEDESNKIFQQSLAKIKPFLVAADFRGYADINCIINCNQIFPLEATMRLGSPMCHLQSEMQITPWNSVLMAVARGEKLKIRHLNGYSMVVSVVTPPFPYHSMSSEYYPKGMKILFKKKLTDKENRRIFFEEVSNSQESFYISGQNGYILYATGSGSTIESARSQVYDLVDKIVIPKVMYRTDIGMRLSEKNHRHLQSYGWITR